MKVTAAILVSLAVGVLHPHADSSATSDPLIEFTYTDAPWAQDSAPDVQQCGYYLLIRGTISHSGGFRPGAAVHLDGDTLAAAVDLYAASVFDPRDARQARWILRIGALGPRAFRLTVAVRGTVLVQRDAKLSFRQESCSA